MAKRLEVLILLVFMVVVLLRPEFLVNFISRPEVLIVLNVLIGGYLLYNLFTLIRDRKTTSRFLLKLGFNIGILILPVLFLTGNLTFDTQTLLLYLIILGFFYTTIM